MVRSSVLAPPFIDARHGRLATFLVQRGVVSVASSTAAVVGCRVISVPWLLAQIVAMPMMGMPLFSGSMELAGGSLVGHLVYGGVVGTIYGPVSADSLLGASPA